MIQALDQYIQQFIFVLTCEWAQLARVLHYIRLKGSPGKKFELIRQFASYDENELL
jgi:hypothetical protein